MPAPHIIPRLLRRQLITTPTKADPSQFILPLRKLVFEYNEQRANQAGLRTYLTSAYLFQIASENPSVEVVVRRAGGAGIAKGFYCQKLTMRLAPIASQLFIAMVDMHVQKLSVQLLLNSSGEKLKHLGRVTVKSETNEEPVRGVWSAFH
ncbi:uncharacterized protein MELLADRAFT_111032 [Melampsora larici-populina 98AG31]|uniref:Ribosomal protein/NADH dehydrogenase domain-containing protein n=1 Tax=Melampsora larici-populina (strain 98AG31 / pathotype 3-4-7) TaxID=747676 RepID=F4S1T7_MELLP|nr:uncharacterized protein MELLADRAFT_111032 [Melampsora larici-populina 98AG31]EGG01431.1 hypothetical protein MELLADRAFT_111032 [Melampsora larici-populina 98AG31]